jgi:predicted ATP-binding protein involved in virulence
MTIERLFVRSLKLENFRCFEKVELGPFDPQFNVLVGTNGAGKSSILLALANGLRKFGEPEVRGLPTKLFEQKDIRVEHWVGTEGVTTLRMRLPSQTETHFSLGNNNFVTVDRYNARDNGITESYRGDSVLSGEQIHPSSPWSDLYIDFYDKPICLIAFYRTARNFVYESSQMISQPQTFRTSGLNNWANAGTNAVGLREWIKNQTLAALQTKLRERQGNVEEGIFQQLLLIKQAIASSVQEAVSIEFDSDRQDLVIQFMDGSRKDFAGMSDGQRTLIGLVADIARRLCLLNASVLGSRTLQDSTGVVFIDELDLHLHPRWQRQVISDLKHVFPNIQFFATTHSPQIIGEARPEEIVLLTPQGQKPRPLQTFGMDSNWVLECVMEADGRDPEVREKIAAMFEAIEQARFDDARRLMEELRETIGEAPDIVAAESYLWNLEHDSGEAAE